MEFVCKRCGYSSEHKSNLKRHLLKKIHCEPIIEDSSIELLISEFDKKYNNKTYNCELCGKKFNSRSNKCKHKDTCKTQKMNIINELQSKIIALSDEVKTLKIISTNNITNNNNTQINNITTNINAVTKIRDFGRENMDALPESLISSLFLELRFRELLANLHCDPNYPENQNIRIKSIKRNTIEIFRNNKWDIVNFTNGLNELLLQGHKIFKEYYKNDKERILREDMTDDELKEILYQLNNIEKLNKNEIKPLIEDIKLMLEEYRSNGSAIIVK